VLCVLARTDHHRFRVLVADSNDTKALRALSRAREDLVQTRVGLANQLRAELERFWSGAAQIFATIDSPIALAFLARYPSPTDAQSLGEKRLAAFLARHGYCGRKQPTELLAKLRSAPAGRAGESEMEARRAIVLALIAALKPIVTKISQLTSEIAHRLRAHPDGHIFVSLFRDPKSVVCAAALLAEIGDCRARYPTAEALAADAGMSPVAVESGKRKVASFRWGCACATPPARWPTPPATGIPGPPTATPQPAPKTTNARSAPSGAPGAAYCGAAGKTAPPMTPPATADCSNTSPSRFSTRPGPAST
jgi:transposase